MIGIPDPESVAEHSFRTAILAYVLASLDGADPMRAATIALFHDTAETRIGDLHRVAKRYVDVEKSEQNALAEQVQRLPQEMSGIILSMIGEYENRNTPEGRIAKEADSLECLIQAREYQLHGHADAEDWVTGCYASLRTETAKRLADSVLQTEPRSWWEGLKIT